MIGTCPYIRDLIHQDSKNEIAKKILWSVYDIKGYSETELVKKVEISEETGLEQKKTDVVYRMGFSVGELTEASIRKGFQDVKVTITYTGKNGTRKVILSSAKDGIHEFTNDENGKNSGEERSSGDPTPKVTIHAEATCSDYPNLPFGFDYSLESIYESSRNLDELRLANAMQSRRWSFDEQTFPDFEGSELIDCNASYDRNSFEKQFCDVQEKARNGGVVGTVVTQGKKQKVSETVGLKCDEKTYDKDSKKYDFHNVDASGNFQYSDANKKYLFAQNSTYKTYGPYVTGEVYPASVNLTCTTTCQEAVVVEYGAPVAVKAGFCFDYQVKATSRVSCSSTLTPPPTYPPTCVPISRCWHDWGENSQWAPGAGPNDSFDTCIDSCDGGKYTSSCSKKCYQKVYGKGSTKTSDLALYNDIVADKVEWGFNADGEPVPGNVNDANVANSASFGEDASNLSSWDYVDEDGVSHTYQLDEDGHVRQSFDGVECDATCYWDISHCATNSFFVGNDSAAQGYYNENVRIYQAAASKCKAASSCSTTKSSFNISINYATTDTPANTKPSIVYPAGSRTYDTIKYSTDGAYCTNDADTSLISSDGCYKCRTSETGNSSGGSDENWYQAEWGILGSWIHGKYGTLVYQNPHNDDLYSFAKGKFCTPLNSKYVNAYWWNYYNSNLINQSENGSDYSVTKISTSASSSTDSNGCTTTCSNVAKTFTSTSSDSTIDWNIHASTKNFGFFHWNIDIGCFYAVGNEYVTDDPICKKTPCGSPNSEYTIRTVDLRNLFPSNTTSDKLNENSIPFNWSQYATNDIKDTGYKSFPWKYKQYLEDRESKKTGYFYDDDKYLDYDIYLTKEDLRKLKVKMNDSTFNYTNWEGETTKSNTFYYCSPLIRSSCEATGNHTGFLGESVLVAPTKDALKCNNIKKGNKHNSCEKESEFEIN